MSAFTEDEIKGIEHLTLEEAWAEIQRLQFVAEAGQKVTLSELMQFQGVHFRCPTCDATYFGSSQEPDGKLTRHCHGNCGYSFSQDEDAQHFYVKISDVLLLFPGIVGMAED
jgi:hypothetical protein